MPRCIYHRIFAVLAVPVLIGLLGCTQADDIYTGISRTEIYLAAERLPNTPAGMLYELWVASESDTISLGKFGYAVQSKKFLELSGANRLDSNRFTLEADIYSYSDMFVSVELATDPNPASPGPIMLIDAITPVDQNPIELRFPTRLDSLENAVARFCLESPSDDSRSGVGRGIWFANYRAVTDNTPDTIGLTVSTEMKIRAYLEPETTFVGDPPVMQIDSIFYDATYQNIIPKEQVFTRQPWQVTNIRKDSTLRLFQSDTLTLGSDSNYHVYMRFDIDSIIDSQPPYEFAEFRFTYTQAPKTIDLDIFSQDDFDLPDYSGMGWYYKGWVLTPYLTSQVANRATVPAWYSVPSLQRYFPHADQALLTTGPFADIREPDFSNPFVLGPKVPPFPGEDFLKTSELQATYGVSSVNLMPFANGNQGTVFITLEPENFPTGGTNFPLVVLITELPSALSAVSGNQASVTMRNWTQTNPQGDLVGFPKITVSLERF